MWKYIVAFAIIFGLTVYVSRQDERTAQERAKETAPLNKGAVSPETNDYHSKENVTDTEGDAPSWYGFFRWPNGTTTWAIILTLLAIVEQTKQTAKAAKSTRKSAAATRKSAAATEAYTQAFREAERSWLVDEIRFPDHIPRRSEHPHGGILMVVFVCKNIGKQPAFIRIVQDRFCIVDTKLPSKPEYRQNRTTVLSGRLLAPDEELIWECPLEEGGLSDDQVDRIQGLSGKRLYLYAYARIRYESAGLVGVNQFCYKWHNLMGVSFEGDKEGFRKDGPDGYNEHT